MAKHVITIIIILSLMSLFSCKPKNQATAADDTFTTPGGKTVTIYPIKHASLRIAFDGKEIQLDPVAETAPKDYYATCPKADLILVTHDHYDHLDKAAIQAVSKAGTQVVCNGESGKQLPGAHVIHIGDTFSPAADISVEAVAAYNTSTEKLQFHPRYRDVGYILTLDGLRIYIAGDTEPIPEMKDIHDIDIAFLPCNLPFTMTPEQCADAARTLRPKVLYPYHYGDTRISRLTELLDGSGIDVRIRALQ